MIKVKFPNSNVDYYVSESFESYRIEEMNVGSLDMDVDNTNSGSV